MKRLLVIPAAALLAAALWVSPASAHGATATVAETCTEGATTATFTFVNDYQSAAIVEINGLTLALPALGTVSATQEVTAPGVLPYTVTWLADEFQQTGTLTVDVLDDCTTPTSTTTTTVGPCRPQINGPSCPPPTTVPACPARVNGPSCPPPPTTAPPTGCPRVNGPSCSLPRVVSTIATDVSLPPAVVEADTATVLAITGHDYLPAVLIGGLLLAAGGCMVMAERVEKRKP